MRAKFFMLLSVTLVSLHAQDQPVSQTELLEKILARLQSLEEQNRQLTGEIRLLRQQTEARAPEQGTAPPIAASATATPLEERVAVNESRVAEQAQTKVEASQKFPISLTGELLFNAFANTGNLAPAPSSVYSPLLSGGSSAGATARQTIIGLTFRGPSLPDGGKVSGDLNMEFYSGAPDDQRDWLRIRSGHVALDWNRRSLLFGQEKPLISPYNPNSLAEVAIPALADAGNLWLWIPQVRYEERVPLGHEAHLVAQAAALQTDETYSSVPDEYSATLATSRPAFEGRLAFVKSSNETRRFEFGVGIHRSSSHVAGLSAASKIASLDWFAKPWSKIELTGTFFHGQNFAGLGGISPGFSILSDESVISVHGNGGWSQISSPLTDRLTANLFAGLQDNRSADVLPGNVLRNFAYAGNLMYRIAPNTIISLEALQARSVLQNAGSQLRNRYDLALAYLF